MRLKSADSGKKTRNLKRLLDDFIKHQEKDEAMIKNLEIMCQVQVAENSEATLQNPTTTNMVLTLE